MASVMAIVSKAVYAKDGLLPSGELADLGDVLPMDHYQSNNKGLDPLADGGRLFLVTVRPPDEKLWLVAVLEQPTFDKKNKVWRSAPNSLPVTDIGALRSKVKFASGKGITAKKGALGMSLQAPRALTAQDEQMLLQAAGGIAQEPAAEATELAPGVGVMAIVSKGVFEKAKLGGRVAGLGDVVPVDRYNSSHRGLVPLAEGGRLFLVTVRPPDEKLWLVAVLQQPVFDEKDKLWQAPSPNRTPITDISALRKKIKFASGKGITTKKGALGMSLQTPRELAEADIKQLLQSAAAAKPAAPVAPVAGTAELPPLPKVKITASGNNELLKAVLSDPDDVHKRLVYADSLAEKGNARGEFIVVQCKLDGEELFFSERSELRLRQRTMLQKYGNAWAKPLGLPNGALRFKRGFVLAIEASVGKGVNGEFLDKARNIFTHEPVQELKLTGCKAKDVEAIAASDWLGRVLRLKLCGSSGDKGAQALASSAGVGALRTLNLGDSGVGDNGAIALAESPHLRRLQILALSGNDIGDRGIAALASSPNLSGCKALYLSRNELGDEGIRALAASPYLTNLQRLCIGDNESVSEAGGEALAATESLPALRYVEVTDWLKPYDELRKRVRMAEV